MTTDTQVSGTDTTQAGTQAADAAKAEAGKGAANVVANASADAAAEPKYEFKLPDGVAVDEAKSAEFVTLAKELKLPPEAAQKLVDLYTKGEQARVDGHAALLDTWAGQVKADKDIGGDKLAESLAVAQKALALGPPELKDLLNSSGLGNHPAVVKWAVAVGKKLSEDSFVPGNGGGNVTTPMYENSNLK